MAENDHSGHKEEGKEFHWSNQMSEASTVETQVGTSPARQMLAALTQASKEMTTKFNEVSDRASKLNALLDSDVNNSLAEINQQAEVIVRLQLVGLSADKDAVLAELTVLRQEELKVLQTIAKNLRDALNEKLNELLSGLKDEVKQQLDIFQKNIGQKETEVIATGKNLRKDLREKLPEQLEAIQITIASQKKEFQTLHERNLGLVAQESKLSLDMLQEHGTTLKERLAKEEASYLESSESTVREMVQFQTERLEKRIQDFSSMHENARPLIHVDMEFLEKEPALFSESCKQVADLRVSMHEGAVKNLAMVYRAEIFSIAQETEDKLVIVRSHLQSVLRSYQDHYTEQSAAILSKFEQEVIAAKPVPVKTEPLPQDDEIPVDMFDKLQKEIRKITKEVVAAADSEMEQGFTEFRSRLASGSQEACTSVETSFHDCRRRVMELAEAQREELEELSHKGDALEQLVDEAKELIGALNPSNLEF